MISEKIPDVMAEKGKGFVVRMLGSGLPPTLNGLG